MEQPVRIPEYNEPEPDIAIVRGSDDDYKHRTPGPADVALLAKVSESTLDRDQGEKLLAYAQGGIAVYWIVNLVEGKIEVYSGPRRDRLSSRAGLSTRASPSRSSSTARSRPHRGRRSYCPESPGTRFSTEGEPDHARRQIEGLHRRRGAARIQADGLDSWTLEDGWLSRKYNTDGWPTTLMLVNAIGYLCEAAWHHADLSVTWGKLWVKLNTHSEGGITDKDSPSPGRSTRSSSGAPSRRSARRNAQQVCSDKKVISAELTD